MSARPLDPPPGHPVRDLSTPNHKDGYYSVLVSRDSVEFKANAPIKRGTKYADIKGARQSVIDAHPNGLWFCQEVVPLRSSEVGGMPGHSLVVWIFSTDRPAQDATNADVSYSGDKAAYPIYARSSFLRREAWEATPTVSDASTLTALIGVAVTAGGSGYTSATGTVGTATVEFVVSGGVIIAGIVTNGGSSITDGASITITGDGTGATATAVIQPAGAVMVHQEKKELPEDNPLSHEFVLVIRVYETLPGPLLPDNRDDLLLGPVQRYRQAVLNTGQTASESATGKITYEARNGSAIVSWKITESWTDGTGDADNPRFPVIEGPLTYDAERGSVHSHSQIVRIVWKVTAATITAGGTGGSNGASRTVTGTTGTGTKFQALVTISGGAITAIESISTPGSYTIRPTNLNAEPVTGASLTGATLNLTVDATQAASMTATAALATRIQYERHSEFLLEKVTETWALPGPERKTTEYEDESGVPVSVTRKQKQRSVITASNTVDSEILTVVEIVASRYGAEVADEVTTVYPKAAAYDATSAIVSAEQRPYSPPGRINISDDTGSNKPIDDYGILVSTTVHDPFPRAELVEHTVKTFWVNSDTKPSVSFQQFLTKSLSISDGDVTRTFNGVLYDSFVLTFGAFSTTVPATSPSWTAFKAMIGTSVLVDGHAAEVRRKRWKVVLRYVTMF